MCLVLCTGSAVEHFVIQHIKFHKICPPLMHLLSHSTFIFSLNNLTFGFTIYHCREPPEKFDPAEFPESYKENLPKEKLVLAYAENFRRQYVHLYRDRKPLFLNPTNECDIEVRKNIIILLSQKL